MDKYICVKDPKDNYTGKIKTWKGWKEEALSWCGDAHSFAFKVNLEALCGRDIVDYIHYVFHLDFQKVEEKEDVEVSGEECKSQE